MRLLHVSATPFPTHQGTQVYLKGLLAAQARAGHDVTLLCWAHGHGDGPDGVRIVRTAHAPGSRHERSGPHAGRLPQTALLASRLRQLVRQGDYDLLHAHNVEAPWIAERLRHRPPLVHHLHTSLEEELPTYVRRGRRMARALGQHLDRTLCRGADASVALSPRGAELLQSWGADLVQCVPPGIDLQELTGDANRARKDFDLGDRQWVLYAGNLDAYQDLLPLLHELAGTQLPVLFVTGSDTVALRRRCRSLGVTHRIVHTTDFTDACDAAAACAAGVVPRERCAGFPMKLLNLVGGGLPVVVRRGAVQGVPGCIEGHDMSEMVALLQRLVGDPEFAASTSGTALTTLREHWTWKARAEQMQALYDQVLRRPARA